MARLLLPTAPAVTVVAISGNDVATPSSSAPIRTLPSTEVFARASASLLSRVPAHHTAAPATKKVPMGTTTVPLLPGPSPINACKLPVAEDRRMLRRGDGVMA